MGTANYWRYWEDSGSSTTGGGYTRGWYNIATSATTSGGWNYYPVVRKYLVYIPKSWDEKIVAKFVSLINDETKTGFKVLMVIYGDIKITDPTIEVRTMENFVPLLRRNAIKDDWAKIELFFKEHGDK